MHLFVNAIDQGVACDNVFASRCFAVVDLFGRCEKVEVLQDDEPSADLSGGAVEALEKAHLDDNQGRKENSKVGKHAIIATDIYTGSYINSGNSSRSRGLFRSTDCVWCCWLVRTIRRRRISCVPFSACRGTS